MRVAAYWKRRCLALAVTFHGMRANLGRGWGCPAFLDIACTPSVVASPRFGDRALPRSGADVSCMPWRFGRPRSRYFQGVHVACKQHPLADETLFPDQAHANSSSSLCWRTALGSVGKTLRSILLQGPPWATVVGQHARRSWWDPQLWTHASFLPGFGLAFLRGVWDLTLLLSVAIPLSLIYHRRRERSGVLALAEGFAAKALFTYGVVQMYYAPTSTFFVVEAVAFCTTVCSFLLCKARPTMYDPWHAYGLHCCPAAWAAVVASSHDPLILFS